MHDFVLSIIFLLLLFPIDNLETSTYKQTVKFGIGIRVEDGYYFGVDD